MKTVDLNADLGEGAAYDAELLGLISSANIACGLHAGSAPIMQQAIDYAKQNNVIIGAHPSFPDRENFGRSEMQLNETELKAWLYYQLGAIQAMCRANGVRLAYVKPHGALYNQAARDEQLAKWIVETVYAFDPTLKLMGLAHSRLISQAEKLGMQTISEVFADRRYQKDGSLVPRSHSQAQLLTIDEVITQVLQMVETGTVNTLDGETIPVLAESICLHGDGPHALPFAQRINQALKAANIHIQAK